MVLPDKDKQLLVTIYNYNSTQHEHLTAAILASIV